MLDETGRELAVKYADVAKAAAFQFWRRAPRADLDELRAVANLGLCQALARFPDYQREHGYALDDHRYLVAYLNRRVHGAVLDWARKQDWLTRTQRHRVNALQAVAVPAGGAAALAEAAGVTVAEVREAEAARASGPVLLEELPGWTDTLADPSADVDSQAAVNGILAAAVRAIGRLPDTQQVIVIRVYLHGEKLAAIADDFGVTEAEVRASWGSAVLEVHDAMLAAVSDPERCACADREPCACGRGKAA